MNEFLPENMDFGSESQKESKKRRHIIIVTAALIISIILGIFIVNLWNLAEINIAKGYVKDHYGDGCSYVSAKALYTGGGCVVSPKESVTVIFQGNDFSVITVVVKNGEVVSVS